jgi:hypothetical protein
MSSFVKASWRKFIDYKTSMITDEDPPRRLLFYQDLDVSCSEFDKFDQNEFDQFDQKQNGSGAPARSVRAKMGSS